MTRRLDIVLLVLDTQRADRLSCYGCPFETSPHLDALAGESTHFAHAVAPAQWTIPSHASMFTGLYPSQHSMLQMDSVLPVAFLTLAERLKQGGYFTAGLSNNPLVGVLNNGMRRGFDSFSNYGGLLTLPLHPVSAQASQPGRYLHHLKRWLAGRLRRLQNTMASFDALNRFLFSPAILPLWQAALKLRGNLKGNTDQTLIDAARLLIERPGPILDQPIFAFINLMGSHVPYVPPQWAIRRYAPQVLRNSAASAFARRFNTLANLNDWLGTALLTAEQKAILDGLYNAEVAAQDIQIGKFLQRLRTSGALDRLLLITVADHGEHLGEKQMVGHAFGAYEELLHVPLLIRDPQGNLPRGATLERFVSTRRVFHTILTAASAATPDEERLTLAPTGADTAYPDSPEQDIVFAEAVPYQQALQRMKQRQPGRIRAYGHDQTCRVIYQGDYKLIVAGTQEPLELYAVRFDPTESRNLQHTLPDLAEALHRRLQNWSQTQNPITSTERLVDSPDVLNRLRDLGYLR